MSKFGNALRYLFGKEKVIVEKRTVVEHHHHETVVVRQKQPQQRQNGSNLSSVDALKDILN